MIKNLRCKKDEIITEKNHLQTYHVERFIDQNGIVHVHRKNDGFNAIELMGFLEYTQLDIYKQMIGNIKPVSIKREVVDRGRKPR